MSPVSPALASFAWASSTLHVLIAENQFTLDRLNRRGDRAGELRETSPAGGPARSPGADRLGGRRPARPCAARLGDVPARYYSTPRKRRKWRAAPAPAGSGPAGSVDGSSGRCGLALDKAVPERQPVKGAGHGWPAGHRHAGSARGACCRRGQSPCALATMALTEAGRRSARYRCSAWRMSFVHGQSSSPVLFIQASTGTTSDAVRVRARDFLSRRARSDPRPQRQRAGDVRADDDRLRRPLSGHQPGAGGARRFRWRSGYPRRPCKRI